MRAHSCCHPPSPQPTCTLICSACSYTAMRARLAGIWSSAANAHPVKPAAPKHRSIPLNCCGFPLLPITAPHHYCMRHWHRIILIALLSVTPAHRGCCTHHPCMPWRSKLSVRCIICRAEELETIHISSIDNEGGYTINPIGLLQDRLTAEGLLTTPTPPQPNAGRLTTELGPAARVWRIKTPGHNGSPGASVAATAAGFLRLRRQL